ncbi:MAG TPA: hypothetical protein DEP35_07670 [Deltaproteobacteria bacterium]|jgi:hypothetical protein|nr:hypothetical protein [Deltaproteobacteria bacterium]
MRCRSHESNPELVREAGSVLPFHGLSSASGVGSKLLKPEFMVVSAYADLAFCGRTSPISEPTESLGSANP